MPNAANKSRKKTPVEGADSGCLFCQIVARVIAAEIVFEDDISLAFLDHRPLFPGHCLLVTKQHYETLLDLPKPLLGPFFLNVQRLTGAVQRVMKSEGTFVAANNVVSQSVPHFHVHVVPRNRKDGLRGFFWPRRRYASEDESRSVRRAVSAEILAAEE